MQLRSIWFTSFTTKYIVGNRRSDSVLLPLFPVSDDAQNTEYNRNLWCPPPPTTYEPLYILLVIMGRGYQLQSCLVLYTSRDDREGLVNSNCICWKIPKHYHHQNQQQHYNVFYGLSGDQMVNEQDGNILFFRLIPLPQPPLIIFCTTLRWIEKQT